MGAKVAVCSEINTKHLNTVCLVTEQERTNRLLKKAVLSHSFTFNFRFVVRFWFIGKICTLFSIICSMFLRHVRTVKLNV